MGKQKTNQEFVNEIKALVGDEYTPLTKYINSSTKVKFYHNVCKKEFDMKPTNFLSNGQRCPHCNSNFGKITIEKVRDAFKKKGLELLSTEYVNSRQKLRYRCSKCGCEHSITYLDLTSKNHGCANCSKNKKLTFADIKNKIESTGEYVLLSDSSDFKNVHSTLRIKHKCGLIYNNCYNNFRNGQRCPLCEKRNSSGGLSKQVRNIMRYLIENNIDFIPEYKYSNLKINSRSARYDFYFKNLNLLIEFHGKQHYEYENNGYFNKEKFKKIKESDKKKYEYAIKNNINIEIIKYTENEIDRIKEILLKYEKI